MFWLQLPHFTFLFLLWSLTRSFLSAGKYQCQVQGQVGESLAGGGWMGDSSYPPLCLAPSLGLLVTMVMLAIPDLPPPSPFWIQFVLPLFPPPLATSPAEPGGVPRAVHGGQVSCQQAGSEDQGAGNTPGV